MVEFRLYYDDNGDVVCYTSEEEKGNYIVIDAMTMAIGNPHVKVIDGKIVQPNERYIISKLVPSKTGIRCSIDDVCIITNEEPTQIWDIKINEYRCN